jgi:copper chaperone CopZ
VLRKPAGALLGEEQLPVGEHVELGACSGSGVRGDVELRGDLGRETRGPCVVAASGGAVEDLDAHGKIVSAGRVAAVPEAIVFEVEQAGCESCAALVRDALEELVSVADVTIDEAEDRATVRLGPGAAVSEADADRVLVAASEGTGHAYRVVPGSWRST